MAKPDSDKYAKFRAKVVSEAVASQAKVAKPVPDREPVVIKPKTTGYAEGLPAAIPAPPPLSKPKPMQVTIKPFATLKAAIGAKAKK